ncbi:hypothetical protein B0H67DRAFT_586850 [Lasiosphaeris hirsuta]|uniref:F-box domain-containing protein n=1 Tax=Lasiosphaeris hirsuta TaxID=260670 RepID=A0AA40AA11_9PEZI|nr:hypothetical protein B0H67DRAFT_586850 [Lasiosphaeris hirsuta]
MSAVDRLPAELIDEIFSFSCACVLRRPNPDRNLHQWSGWSDLSTLWSLCLTSRQFKNIATRHLYHCPSGARGVATWWLLARTLIACPDIATHVKGLYMDAFDDLGGSELPHDISTLYSSGQLVRAEGRPGEDHSWLLARLMLGKSAACLDLMTALCPNLETLDAVIDMELDSITFTRPQLFAFCPPKSMQALTSLTVSPKNTEDGMDLEEIWDLLNAAPNLTTIRCYDLKGCSDRLALTLGRVTSLDLRSSALDDDSLANIFCTFPNLETFTYQSGPTASEIPFFIWDIKDILRYALKLTTFTLDLAADEINWNFTDRQEYCDEDWDDLKKALGQRGIALDYKWRGSRQF